MNRDRSPRYEFPREVRPPKGSYCFKRETPASPESRSSVSPLSEPLSDPLDNLKHKIMENIDFERKNLGLTHLSGKSSK